MDAYLQDRQIIGYMKLIVTDYTGNRVMIDNKEININTPPH